MLKGKRKKGFTLVELMVVIAIIAVLLLIAVPRLSEATKGARVRTFEGNFRTAMSALNSAYADNGMDPDKINKLPDHPAVKDLLGSGTTKGSIDNKPATAKYELSGETLTGKMKVDPKSPADDYVVTFNVKTGELAATTNHDLGALVPKP
ncbi:MAG: type II secretion system protein [Peptostreptococcaceae bacterium]|nr:type II secretion system protein [Peptostreptococcaceae bacterium]